MKLNENYSLQAVAKAYMENSPLGKFFRKFSGRIFLRNNAQCRYFVAAVDSGPISLSYQSQADITGDQPISITIKRANLKHIEIFLAPFVHANLLLADITSMPHNPILSRCLTW